MPTTTTLLALVVRVTVALLTCTFFQPDEFFQALEPGHNIAFGYGHITWEWLGPRPIRSMLYPALNVPVYWLLKAMSLENTDLIIYLPKALHGSCAALTDIWIRRLAKNVLGEKFVTTTYFLSLTSLFHFMSLSRSMSNSLETSLSTIAFAYYPWRTDTAINRQDVKRALAFSAIACAIRPPNAIIWVFLFGHLVWRLRSRILELNFVIKDALITFASSIIVLFVLDTLCYGRPTLTPLNFLLTNLSSVSLFYGSSPWHYYLSQGLPLLCGTALPWVLLGAWQVARTPVSEQRDSGREKETNSRVLSQKTVLACVIWTISVYSLTGHKEWRFLHPILPLLHLLAANALLTPYTHSRTSPTTIKSDAKSTLPLKKTTLFFLSLSVPTALVPICLHGAPQISAMYYLRSVPEPPESVGILAPCHSFPAHSYLHRHDLDLWALGCEPPLGLSSMELEAYADQTDVFYADPKGYLTTKFPEKVHPGFPRSALPATPPGVPVGMYHGQWGHEWPRMLVFFGKLLEREGVKELLERKGYRELWRSRLGWAAIGEEKRSGGVRVWRWDGVL